MPLIWYQRLKRPQENLLNKKNYYYAISNKTFSSAEALYLPMPRGWKTSKAVILVFLTDTVLSRWDKRFCFRGYFWADKLALAMTLVFAMRLSMLLKSWDSSSQQVSCAGQFVTNSAFNCHEPLKVGNSTIFKCYLLPHLQWGLANDDGFLNYGTIPRFFLFP